MFSFVQTFNAVRELRCEAGFVRFDFESIYPEYMEDWCETRKDDHYSQMLLEMELDESNLAFELSNKHSIQAKFRTSLDAGKVKKMVAEIDARTVLVGNFSKDCENTLIMNFTDDSRVDLVSKAHRALDEEREARLLAETVCSMEDRERSVPNEFAKRGMVGQESKKLNCRGVIKSGESTASKDGPSAHPTLRGDSADVRGTNVRLMAMKFGGVKSDQRSALSGK
jgi:hypothetical protein